MDLPISRWEASFLPRDLSRNLQRVKLPSGRPLAAAPRVVYQRRGGDALAGDALAGGKLLWGGAALAWLLALAMVLLARRDGTGRRLAGLALALLALPLGLAGLLCWSLCALSTLPELRQTELVAVLWPMDLLLLGPAVAWLRGRFAQGRLLRVYAHLRLVAVTLVLLGHATGLLYQQPRALVVAAAGLAVGFWVAAKGEENTKYKTRNTEPETGNGDNP